MKTSQCTWALLLLGTAGVASADAPKTNGDDVAAIARHAWSITNLVLEHDIEPPARQQMLLLGLRALLRHTSKTIPANLAARVSDARTSEQLAAILADYWKSDKEGIDSVFFQGLMSWRPMEGFETPYLSATERKAYEVSVGNRYVGTGIQIRVDEKSHLMQIVVPFPGGPARKAGARPGDLIVAVDDESMTGKSIREVVKRLQGEEGTKVSMTVRQPDESATRQLPMVRSVIPFNSIEGYRRIGEESWAFRPDVKAPIAYLAVNDITSSTPLELRHVEPLLKDDGARAVVLDLRFTRGRDIRYAALLADFLLDGGVLWRVRDVRGKVKEYKADRDCLFRDLPMVVLVSEQTGRMGAIVATALQDRGRAILVGQPPNGDLSITGLVALPDGDDALLLRTGTVERTISARTETQRQALAENRVAPDHVVSMARPQFEALTIWRNQQQSPEPKGDNQPPRDAQLEKALELLRKKT